MKTSNITIRVSIDLKNDLKDLANKSGVSESEFVRRLIQDAVSQKPEKNKELEDRLRRLEQKQDLEITGLESKFIMALAYIFSIDTGLPIHEIISLTTKYQNEIGYASEALDRLSRDERENVFMQLYEFFNAQFAPSESAYLMVESIFMTFLSFVYPSPIFMVTPFSMNTINRFEKIKSYLREKRIVGSE